MIIIIASDVQLPKFKPEFLAWFSGSKIVDANGMPMKVYHGTNEKFKSFEENFMGANEDGRGSGAWGKGFYFSEEPKVSAGYGKNIMAVYLNIKRPLVLDFAKGFSSWEQDPKTFRDMTGIGQQTHDATDWAKRKGYDGVVLIDTSHTGAQISEEIVAFSASQIMSAENAEEQPESNSRVVEPDPSADGIAAMTEGR